VPIEHDKSPALVGELVKNLRFSLFDQAGRGLAAVNDDIATGLTVARGRSPARRLQASKELFLFYRTV
jgi:hypothetical protein